jgi:hypothetical protein
MTTETEIKAAFTHGGAAISPETAERFAAQMRERGLDPSAALAKHGHGASPEPMPTTDQVVKPAQRLALDIDPATGFPRLTPAQVEQAAQTLREHWTGSPETLEAALAAAGAKPLTPAVPDDRSPEAVEFDNSALAAPADGAGYSLDGIWLGREADLATLAKTEQAMRSTMAELKVPSVLGRQFAEDLLSGAATWAELSGDTVAVQQHHASENALFARATKVSWAEASAAMKPWLAAMSEGTRSYLASSGALEAASVRVRLWQAFTLQRARAGMKGGAK